MTKEHVLALLLAAGLLCDPDDDDPDAAQTLRLNDVWAWGTSDAAYIPDEEVPKVGHLFVLYGWCGILYWVSEQHGKMRSQLGGINRSIDFVRMEERIRQEESDGLR